MTIKLSEIILTRYLYNKPRVIESLEAAINTKEYELALYWAYEIYYSGFEDEIIQFLIAFVETRFTHHVKLCAYIRKKYNEYAQTYDVCKESGINDSLCILSKDPTIVATIIKNMLIKNYTKPETSKPRFIAIKKDQIEKYNTVEPMQYIPLKIQEMSELNEIIDGAYPNSNLHRCKWKHLSIVCEKAVHTIQMTKKEEIGLLNIFRHNWIFYASRSPIWKMRILEYHGKIDGRKKTVEFENDDDLEGFYDTYDYEPDEQSIYIQKKCMGIV
jgi:hypothetical protein